MVYLWHYLFWPKYVIFKKTFIFCVWILYFQIDYFKRSVHETLYKDKNKTTVHPHFSLPIKKMYATDVKKGGSLIHKVCKRLEGYSLGRIRQDISNTIPKLKQIRRGSNNPGLKHRKCLHRPQHTAVETAEFLTCQHMFHKLPSATRLQLSVASHHSTGAEWSGVVCGNPRSHLEPPAWDNPLCLNFWDLIS